MNIILVWNLQRQTDWCQEYATLKTWKYNLQLAVVYVELCPQNSQAKLQSRGGVGSATQNTALVAGCPFPPSRSPTAADCRSKRSDKAFCFLKQEMKSVDASGPFFTEDLFLHMEQDTADSVARHNIKAWTRLQIVLNSAISLTSLYLCDPISHNIYPKSYEVLCSRDGN